LAEAALFLFEEEATTRVGAVCLNEKYSCFIVSYLFRRTRKNSPSVCLSNLIFIIPSQADTHTTKDQKRGKNKKISVGDDQRRKKAGESEDV
jgi:hypothetical protein